MNLKYYIITVKIGLRCNSPFIYSFLIPRSIRVFHKIKNNFQFIKTMAKTSGNIPKVSY